MCIGIVLPNTQAIIILVIRRDRQHVEQLVRAALCLEQICLSKEKERKREGEQWLID